MSQLHIFAKSSNVQQSSDGNSIGARGTLDGVLFTANWKEALAAEGRVFSVTIGALSTPIAGGGAAAIIDLDRPRFGVSVDAGTTLIPLSVKIQALVPLLATDADESEILLAADISAAYAGDGTVVTEVPQNNITGGGVATAATAFSLASADITDPVLGIEIDRAITVGDLNGAPANALTTELKLNYQVTVPYFLTGPCALYGYWGGTVATTAFAQVVWAEVPTSRFTV